MISKLKQWTPKQIKMLKHFFAQAIKAENGYREEILYIEGAMRQKFGIEVELFHVDGELVGIGDYFRTMALLPREKLEKL